MVLRMGGLGIVEKDYRQKKSKPEDAPNIRETQMTYEDYAAMPDDGKRYELVDGQLELMSPSPTLTHQIISSNILHLLHNDCRDEYVIVSAPIDVVLSPTEVRQPDLIMIHRSRLSIHKEQGSIVAPPDLVVEILSPSSLQRDRIDKRAAYARFGVPEYWIIDPSEQGLEQYALDGYGTYQLLNIYTGNKPIHSEKLKCVTFAMDDVMEMIRDRPDA